MHQTPNKKIVFQDLGQIDYQVAWDYQKELQKGIVATKIANRKDNQQQLTNNYLLFCSHPPVYTLGKSGDVQHLLLNDVHLKDKNISFYKINRGGDITYHGPGQIIGYPILDLDNFFTDLHQYMRLLEETMIRTLAEYGIVAGRIKGSTGVWLDAANPLKARKICAFGVHCSRWVTMHGWAFNVNTDLSYFNHIIPCGIRDKGVTSLHKELGVAHVPVEEVKEKVKRHFLDLFEAELIMGSSVLSNR